MGKKNSKKGSANAEGWGPLPLFIAVTWAAGSLFATAFWIRGDLFATREVVASFTSTGLLVALGTMLWSFFELGWFLAAIIQERHSVEVAVITGLDVLSDGWYWYPTIVAKVMPAQPIQDLIAATPLSEAGAALLVTSLAAVGISLVPQWIMLSFGRTAIEAGYYAFTERNLKVSDRRAQLASFAVSAAVVFVGYVFFMPVGGAA